MHEDSIPLTAVCTQAGNYERTVMPMGLASSSGWFQSIMLRVCDGLKHVRLFIDDIVCFSKNGAEHVSCLLYTSPSPRDGLLSRMPSSA